MLHTLHIRDFVIVDQIELEFAPGFTVFTGETGAGKSILIDALSLALGARGDASMVREGASRTDICAAFKATPEALAWLNENEMQAEDGQILLRRVIDNNGRSKAWINGATASASQLRDIGELLVNIHGQHMHQSLLKDSAQRQMLDNLLPPAAQSLLPQVQQAWRQWQATARQCREFEANAKNVLQERERLQWQVSELEKLAPKAGEWQEVTQEHSRLAHAASLLDGAQEALQIISESDHPILSQLSSLNQRLGKLAAYDENLKSVLDCTEPARIQLQEAVYALNDYLGRLELDPARLAQIEARVEALHSASRKFRVQAEDLPQEYENLAQQLQQLDAVADMDALRAQEEKLQQVWRKLAQQLSAARQDTAHKLSQAVSDAMQSLAMAGGRFEVSVQEGAAQAHGADNIEFLVAGHAGVSLRPLAKVASGGELARIALAISVIASSAATTPTLIFDEVDSGIGGATAEVVGRLLQKLGQERQVLCVTHLPQVAGQGNQHFKVAKRGLENGRTASSINLLSADARVEEVARMLGGLDITDTTRKMARELLAL
ncbi:DNA repair protein RecN [Massilia sp. W12]|uniref:DNA repair protein RecN n=1 Tax=Massilia sp. W12 TaxID=3126507 RepID=UPI0030D27050